MTSAHQFYIYPQLEALRGTVRFLRSENQFLKGQDFLHDIQALPPLRSPRRRPARHERPQRAPPTPPLDADDTDEHEDEELKEVEDVIDVPVVGDKEEERNPSIRELVTEAKLLYRELLQYSATPKVVDLSVFNTRPRTQLKPLHPPPSSTTDQSSVHPPSSTSPSISPNTTTAANPEIEAQSRSQSKSTQNISKSPDVSMGDDVPVRTTRGWIPRKKMPAYQVQERKEQGQELGRRVQGLLERVNALGVPRR